MKCNANEMKCIILGAIQCCIAPSWYVKFVLPMKCFGPKYVFHTLRLLLFQGNFGFSGDSGWSLPMDNSHDSPIFKIWVLSSYWLVSAQISFPSLPNILMGLDSPLTMKFVHLSLVHSYGLLTDCYSSQ